MATSWENLIVRDLYVYVALGVFHFGFKVRTLILTGSKKDCSTRCLKCRNKEADWFKLYFNCYKYKHIITENIKYPGSDKKPKACPKVIS